MTTTGRLIRFARSGGVAGMRVEREVDLDRLDADQAAAWRRLLDDAAIRTPDPPERSRPDGYGYRITSAADGIDVSVAEQQLPPEHRALLEQAIRRSGP